MLILDGCCLFEFDEPLPEGTSTKHALKTRVNKIMQETQNTLFARACGPNATATDTGKYSHTWRIVKVANMFGVLVHRYSFLIYGT